MREWDDNLSLVVVLIFARLMRSGWATWPPLSTVIFVLSKERIVPNKVAPGGSCDYLW